MPELGKFLGRAMNILKFLAFFASTPWGLIALAWTCVYIIYLIGGGCE